MYVGRIVAVGLSQQGASAAMYRVSSRSFPNRHAVILNETAAIVPKPGHEGDIQKNPYIAYNCLRLTGEYAVATNGTQTDPVCEKLSAGLPPRDALASVLLTLDYEKDAYNTPRIAAVINRRGDSAYLGIARHDALLVRKMDLQPGRLFYICTYEHNFPDSSFADNDFAVSDPLSACDYLLGQGVFAEFERPVTAACAVAGTDGFSLAAREAVSG